jgi:GNAT superfamily N-acetyltransferase
VLLGGWKYLTPPSDDPYQAFSHPWLPHALHAHVLAAPLWLLAIGWMLRDHIVGRWRSGVHRRGRRTGVATAVLLLPMAGSGYLLQTATSEGLRRALVWIHVVSGLGYIAGFLAHAVISRLGTARTARSRALEKEPQPARSLPAAGARGNLQQ